MTRPRRHSTAIAALVYRHWRGDLRELADTAGINNATLHRILRGQTVPSLPTVIRLSRALQVPTKNIFNLYADFA